MILMVKKLMERFIKTEKFKIEKVFKRKGDELYVKWKCWNNLLKSGIDKKDVV